MYAGAFVDVLYDHFLANDKNEFTNEAELNSFSQHTYSNLQINLALLPPKFQQVFPYMKSQNWLYNYQYKQGIEKSFGGLVKRAAYLSESEWNTDEIWTYIDCFVVNGFLERLYTEGVEVY